MLHRKFKIIRTEKSLRHLDEALNDGKDLKSLSICEVGKEAIISIGYDDTAASEHEYHLVVEPIGDPASSAEDIQKKVEEIAENINGIICQDLAVIADELFVTFLTVK